MEFPRALDPFRALSASFRVLSAATGPILLGGILLTIVGGGGPRFGFSIHDGRFDPDFLPLVIGLGGCLGLAFFVFESWLSIGYARAVEEVERTGSTVFERLFDSAGRFGDMLLARVLAALLAIAIALPWGLVALACVILDGVDAPEALTAMVGVLGFLAYLPVAIYLLLGLCFVMPAVALDGLSPTHALSRSWELARGRRLALFWFSVVTAIFAVAGICACCAGVFLTVPLSLVAWNDAYLALTRGAERGSWWIEGGRSTPPFSGPGTGPSGSGPVRPSSSGLEGPGLGGPSLRTSSPAPAAPPSPPSAPAAPFAPPPPPSAGAPDVRPPDVPPSAPATSPPAI